MALALEVTNKGRTDEARGTCDCDALWGAQIRDLDQLRMRRLLVAP